MLVSHQHTSSSSIKPMMLLPTRWNPFSHKGVGDQRQYLVRWKGFSSEHDSCEPVANFDTQDVIKKYHQAARLSQSSVKGSRRHANKVPVKSRSNRRAKK